MVRTRATRVKPNPDSAAALNKESQDSAYGSPTLEDKPRELLLLNLKKQIDAKRRSLQDQYCSALSNFETYCDMIKMKIGPHYGNMLLVDFVKGDLAPPEQYDSFVKPSNSSASSRNFATSTVRKMRDSPPSPAVIRVTRQSRQNILTRSISEDNLSMIVTQDTTVQVKKPPTRRTRSVSTKRQSIAKSIYETPAGKNRTLVPVTPKADPSTTALKRHPRIGEFALSLTGSPLMIPAGCSETNITLPLENGEVYSILPTDDFVVGQIPALSEDTRRQILQLRKNLDRLLKK